MFKSSYWIILFFIVFFAFYIPFEYDVQATGKMQQENLRLEEFGVASAQAALKEADIYAEEVFADKTIQKHVIDTFYTTYAMCANYKEDQINSIKYMVPCLLLVDWDGYYVSYTQWYNTTGEMLYTDIITEKNYWTQQYGSYLVQYTLDETVIISDMSEKEEIRYEGRYSDVFEQLLTAKGQEIKELEHFKDAKTFEEERNLIVIDRIEKTAEYYVNTHNEMYNRTSTNYDILLPTTVEHTMASCLTMPSIIAFIQGEQARGKTENVNIYTYIGVDLEEETTYYVTIDETGERTYHTKDCVHRENHVFEGSMIECANLKANPGSCVYGNLCEQKD